MLDLTKRTVIVVDDETFIRQTVARMLSSLGATKIVQAEDGEAALAESWTIEGGPALVISDFNMPKIDGLALLKAVRMGQSGLDRAVPFVMLTAHSDRDVVDVALKLDISAFLLKPVSRAALEKRLNRLARSEEAMGWLKPEAIYAEVDADLPPEIWNSAIVESADPQPVGWNKKPAPRKPGGADVSGLQRDPQELAEAMARGPSAASDAGAELLRHLLSAQSEEAEAIEGSDETAQSIAAKFAILGNGSLDSATASRINAGIERAILEMGLARACDLVAALDCLGQAGAVSPGDLENILDTDGAPPAPYAPPAIDRTWHEAMHIITDIPPDAVTTQNIFTIDGKMLAPAGTVLTPTLVRLLAHLDRVKALDLPSDAALGQPVIRLVAPPAQQTPEPEQAAAPRAATRVPPRRPAPVRKGPERAVGPTEIAAGMVLTRDIRTIHGAIYLGAGTTLTERQVGVLESLYESSKLTSKIWISI